MPREYLQTIMMPSLAGVGIGVRAPHLKEILETRPSLPWVEIHPENFITAPKRSLLREISALYPVSFHGVGLSLGSPSLNRDHLRFLKDLVNEFNPVLFSEHVAWNQLEGVYYNDLFPLPYTSEALMHLSRHIRETQEVLERSILIENPSRYVSFPESTWCEADFMKALVEETGCRILLDLNNVYVSCHNTGGDPFAYVNTFHGQNSVAEIHLAGHEPCTLDQRVLVDTHGAPIVADVWDLYAHAVEVLGPVPTLIEWDTNIPPVSVLYEEARKATEIMERCHVAS